MSKRLKDTDPLGCPDCGKPTLVRDHGINRARPNGRNLYCKACIRDQVGESRRLARLARQAQRDALQRRLIDLVHDVDRKPMQIAQAAAPAFQLTPAERLIVALREGHHTRQAIKRRTKLCMTDVCDLLAELMDVEVYQRRGQPGIFLLKPETEWQIAV